MTQERRCKYRTGCRWAVRFVVALLVLAIAGVLGKTWLEARKLVTNPPAVRKLPQQTPADFGLVFSEVAVTTADGLRLVGWYVPGRNGALVIAQHGYKSQRGEMLEEAQMLARRGYGVLLTSLRAHDRSDGEVITFGVREIEDANAWYRYALTLPGVDGKRIGMLGNSMGAVIAIEYAAQQPGIRALVAHSPFSSLDETIATSVSYYTGLPPFPFAALIQFWAERRLGVGAASIDAKHWIGSISPRPVLILQGGADVTVIPQSGRLLYAAAGEPKELWFEPELGHANFDTQLSAEYERRVGDFFDRHLLPH
ncbi:MAG: alpha/beta hydrolase [Rhodocyclaceae bacterium]|jgi:fermentation-respiration switch protein FrsA (DUF1100 family)|nr:alpha/beta hydrolase [Rhodocyclaceae bacterium]